jgi:hypothetical protein
MKAREIVAEIVQHGLAPALQREGFRKRQLDFARRRGTVAAFIQVQLSSWNQGSVGAFFVNVGVMFDEMRLHYGRGVPAIPKYDDCDFMVRLERLVPGAPAQWNVDAQTDRAILSACLASWVMDGVVAPLDQVSSLAEFQRLGWTEAVPWSFPAHCEYLLGNLERAGQLVQAEAAAFKDRGVTYDELIRRYRFSRLQR